MNRISMLFDALSAILPQMTIFRNEPMSRHTTFRTGGPASLWAQPRSGDELAQALITAREIGVEPVLLGVGSNVLIPDEGLDTLVLQTRGMQTISVDHERITADCGVTLRRIAVFAQEHSLTGFEFAHGIPGSLGGGIYMNAGAYGGEMNDVIFSVRVLLPDNRIVDIPHNDLDFHYRHSVLESLNAVALSAEIQLSPGDPAEIAAKMADLMARRSASQPLEYPSAGSTFKRPAVGYAAAMIDSAGLKGFSIGGAQVSEKHAGFIINRENATTADILNLMAKVQDIVFDQTGVRLEPEVRIIPYYKEGLPCNF